MFGLFKKKAPLTVKEIETAIYNGYLNFEHQEASNFSILIPSYKRKYPSMCPRSLLLNTDELDGTEIYGMIWTYIIHFVRDSGLKVNMNHFARGEYLGDVLDGYVSNARNSFRSNAALEQFWVGDATSNRRMIQNALDVGDKREIEELIKKSHREQKRIQTSIPWHKAIAFASINKLTASPKSRGFYWSYDSPNIWPDSSDDLDDDEGRDDIFVSFFLNEENFTTDISATQSK